MCACLEIDKYPACVARCKCHFQIIIKKEYGKPNIACIINGGDALEISPPILSYPISPIPVLLPAPSLRGAMQNTHTTQGIGIPPVVHLSLTRSVSKPHPYKYIDKKKKKKKKKRKREKVRSISGHHPFPTTAVTAPRLPQHRSSAR